MGSCNAAAAAAAAVCVARLLFPGFLLFGDNNDDDDDDDVEEEEEEEQEEQEIFSHSPLTAFHALPFGLRPRGSGKSVKEEEEEEEEAALAQPWCSSFSPRANIAAFFGDSVRLRFRSSLVLVLEASRRRT